MHKRNYKFLEGEGFNWLDLVPEGWVDLFLEMCEKLEEILIKNNALDDFVITDVKEKYGELRVYNNCGLDEVDDLISEYEIKSRNVCILCGKQIDGVSLGYSIPLCVECARKM